MLLRQSLAYLVFDDIGYEDVTTQALIPPNLDVSAKILAKEEGVVSGVEVSKSIFMEFSIRVTSSLNEGAKVIPGDIIMELEGDARSILTLERTILNLMMRMSGIATLTNGLVELVHSVNPNIIVAATRKTTPGIQFLEKEAVRAGGGDTHRFRLDDCVMIKDNHLVLVKDVNEAVKRARAYASFTKKIEVEADTINQALQIAHAGADVVLLDNMSPERINEVIGVLKGEGLRDKILVEASGGITKDNILDYANTEVDVISTGYLTHSAKSLDLTLEIDII